MIEDIDKSISKLQEEAYKKGRKSMKKKLIAEFLSRLNWICERVEFHTENPDSELLDELIEEYHKWEARRQSGATDK